MCYKECLSARLPINFAQLGFFNAHSKPHAPAFFAVHFHQIRSDHVADERSPGRRAERRCAMVTGSPWRVVDINKYWPITAVMVKHNDCTVSLTQALAGMAGR